MVEHGLGSDADATSPATSKQARERSRIEFPYSELDNAVQIAATINGRAGTSCEPEQLAGWMDQSASGGTFRSRLGAARLFGLVETERGSVSLTTLGREILDSTKERSARVTAFLNVELFREMYDRYKGYTLPPAAAIERQMIELGVPPKQAERARQTFMKSALQANFVDPSSGRMVKPAFGAADDAPPDDLDKLRKGGGGGGGGNDDLPPGLDPVIKSLLTHLPPAGSVWPNAKRELWLQLVKGSFELIYKDGRDAEPDHASKREGQSIPPDHDLV